VKDSSSSARAHRKKLAPRFVPCSRRNRQSRHSPEFSHIEFEISFMSATRRVYNRSPMSDALERLTASLEPILERVDRLLHQWVGKLPSPEVFDRCHAFRWRSGRGVGRLEPIDAIARFDLDDLIGVDRAIESLDRNTRQLLAGLPFNDVLLHGERGTGKSSAVRGLLSRYAGQGLRVVEVDRNDLAELPQLLVTLREGTASVPDQYSFLVFCDDLSFGESELGFRELKAALEGGIEARPERVCVVTTSNRRHLLPETMEENRQARVDESGQLHLGEVLEEKLALADRFGLVLGFYACTQAVYLEIVQHWLRDEGEGELDELARESALRFALARGGRSGRIARQFANQWIGRTRLAEQPASRR
jgi:predicted AAA+ superfamily ATPase